MIKNRLTLLYILITSDNSSSRIPVSQPGASIGVYVRLEAWHPGRVGIYWLSCKFPLSIF